MAIFAKKHGYTSAFGRIELVSEVKGQLKRIDLMDDAGREAIKKSIQPAS